VIVKRNIKTLEKDINEMENLIDLNVSGMTKDLKKKIGVENTLRDKSKRCLNPSQEIFH